MNNIFSVLDDSDDDNLSKEINTVKELKESKNEKKLITESLPIIKKIKLTESTLNENNILLLKQNSESIFLNEAYAFLLILLKRYLYTDVEKMTLYRRCNFLYYISEKSRGYFRKIIIFKEKSWQGLEFSIHSWKFRNSLGKVKFLYLCTTYYFGSCEYCDKFKSNIDEFETIKNFGHHPYDDPPNSNKITKERIDKRNRELKEYIKNYIIGDIFRTIKIFEKYKEAKEYVKEKIDDDTIVFPDLRELFKDSR